ncbi:MAG: hypothetical protein K4304_07120 [Propionicimonas sp.]
MMKKLTAMLAVVAALFLMAGCSIPGGAVPDGKLACADAVDEIETMFKAYQKGMGNIYSDPMAAASDFDELSKKVTEASKSVHNEKVSAAFASMATAATDMASAARESKGDITAIGDGFNDASGRFADGMAKVNEVCNA